MFNDLIQKPLWNLLILIISIGSYTEVRCQSTSAPGGVQGQNVWLLNGEQDLVSNYRSVNLRGDFLSLSTEDFKFDKVSTVFFVLKPKGQGLSSLFLKAGDIGIYGDRILHGRVETPIPFEQDRPVIITVDIQRSSPYSLRKRHSLELGDTTLFNLAEMVVYQGCLPRLERRKICTNLALKYGFPITTNYSPIWRSYLSSKSQKYWDIRLEQIYSNRVLALGASANEDFYQTQTSSETGWDIGLALNYLTAEGEMPDVAISDGAFVVFSEKDEDAMNVYNCENQNKTHLLHDWKLHLIDWNSLAQSILIEVPLNSHSQDSLFITDGQYMYHVPMVSQSYKTATYAVYLSPLQNNTHYFFTNRITQDCLDSIFSIQGSQVTVNSPFKSGFVDFISLQDSSDLSLGFSDRQLVASPGSGQFLVRLRNSEGEVVNTRFIHLQNPIQENLRIVDVRIYPNPVRKSQTAILEMSHLPSKEDIRIYVSDARGRILQEESIPYSPHIQYPIDQCRVPGMYSITAEQGNKIYSLKLIVSSAE